MENINQAAFYDGDVMYHDAEIPKIPEQVFGVDSQRVLEMSHLIGGVAMLAPENMGPIAEYGRQIDKSSEDVVRMGPLLEKVVRQEELSVEEVRPYRGVIKNIIREESTGFRWAERVTGFFSFFGIRTPQRMLNSYVETEFLKRAPEKVEAIIEKAKKGVGLLGRYVEVVTDFDDSLFSEENKDLGLSDQQPVRPAANTSGEQEEAARSEQNFNEKRRQSVASKFKIKLTKSMQEQMNSMSTRLFDIHINEIVRWLKLGEAKSDDDSEGVYSK